MPTVDIDLSLPETDDPLSFLYDILCQRDEIFAYTKAVEQFVDDYIQTLKEIYDLKNSIISSTLLYSSVFYCLYQMNKNFFDNWKSYFSMLDRIKFNAVNGHTVDDRDFAYFKRFGKDFTLKLKGKGMKRDFNLAVGANSSYAVLYPFLVFIEKMQREMNHIKNKETLSQFFIRYLYGGRVLATSLAPIPEIALNTTEKVDIRKIIDSFRYIDLSDGLLRGKNSSPRFSGYNDFYIIIYKMLVKSWNYYLQIPIYDRKRHEVATLLRENFPCDMLLLARNEDTCCIEKFFKGNERLTSTHPFYTTINNTFFNKTKSWFSYDVIDVYSLFVYCHIKELDNLIARLNEEPTLLGIKPELITNLSRAYEEKEFSEEAYCREKKLFIEKYTDSLMSNNDS